MIAGSSKAPTSAVDWAEIRRRVDAAGRALTGETSMSAEQVGRLLEERARVLARPAAAAPAGNTLEVITFKLANESYAIESRHVTAVFRLIDLTPLPGAAPPVFGVTAWRGDLLTILDLRAALGHPATALNDLSWVIVLGDDRPTAGFLVDAVLELVPLPVSEVRALPDAVAARRDLLHGVTADAVLVLAGERLVRLLGPDPPVGTADT
jgi:purine-binding chemotaxis protein CheW